MAATRRAVAAVSGVTVTVVGVGGGGGAGAGVVVWDDALPESPHPTVPIKAGSPADNAMRIRFRIICLVP